MLKAIITILSTMFIPYICNAADITPSIVHALQTKIGLIAIDPGFGGNITGPSGCDNEVFAKTINLQIAKKVATKIEEDLRIDVMLTRNSDEYISLEERTSLANTKNADLLISIHTNGSEYASVSGIETFILNLAIDDEVITIAASKNTKDPKNIAELDSILQELMQYSNVTYSDLLARNVHNHMFEHLREKNENLLNRGIKQAPFYILLGSVMPSIIIETGFITNPEECKLLSSEDYQEDISIGIVEGVRAYINEILTQPVNSADPKCRAAD
jgi:N-acetylmuramoyl-L-alanine amidase